MNAAREPRVRTWMPLLGAYAPGVTKSLSARRRWVSIGSGPGRRAAELVHGCRPARRQTSCLLYKAPTWLPFGTIFVTLRSPNAQHPHKRSIYTPKSGHAAQKIDLGCARECAHIYNCDAAADIAMASAGNLARHRRRIKLACEWGGGRESAQVTDARPPAAHSRAAGRGLAWRNAQAHWRAS